MVCKRFDKTFNSHPYWIAASLSYYAFIYIDFHFGWEMYRPIKLMILYDRMSQDIKYGIFMVEFSEDPDDFSYKTSFKEIGSRHMEEIIFIDDMLTFDPQNITCHFDVSSYEIIIKSGSQQRFVYIQSPEKDKYGPFKWLFDLTAEIKGDDSERMLYRRRLGYCWRIILVISDNVVI